MEKNLKEEDRLEEEIDDLRDDLKNAMTDKQRETIEIQIENLEGKKVDITKRIRLGEEIMDTYRIHSLSGGK